MPVRVFTEEERSKLMEAMLEAGLPLLRTYGMTHMSVEKITEAAQIGKSTFYNFFSSKEAYVCEVISHNRKKFLIYLADKLNDREKLTQTEAQDVLRQIIFSQDSAYQYLRPEDVVRIRAIVPEEVRPDLAHETEVLSNLFARFENVREEPDYGVIANLLKTMALAAESQDELHVSAYERMQNTLFDLLFSLIFCAPTTR